MVEGRYGSRVGETGGGGPHDPFSWSFLAAKIAIDAWQWWLQGGELGEGRPEPDLQWTTPNTIALEIADLRLRDFSLARTGAPVLICAPYALHGASIADFAAGHSIVEALRNGGVARLYLAEWRSASPDMSSRSIDSYLSDLNVAVDDIGHPVDLVGLCQGGWLSLIYAARFPSKVRCLVLAGVPVDMSVGSALSRAVASMSSDAFKVLVDSTSGLVRGEQMRRFWGASPDPTTALQRTLSPDILSDRQFVERFDRWQRQTLDLPGTFFLQTVNWIFRENRLAAGEFVALGHAVQLNRVSVPVFLLAGANDEVVPAEQALATASLLGTPDAEIETAVAPSSHLGLFMGRETIGVFWARIADWLRSMDGMSL